MEKSNNGEFLSKDQIREIFGPPPPRKPIPSYSFNTLVKIFSLFPNQNQNPFSNYASYANLPEYLRRHDDNDNLKNLKRLNSGNVQNESVENRGEKEYSDELVDRGTMDKISLDNDTNDDMSTRIPCKDDNFNGSEKLEKIPHTTKTMDKAGFDVVAIDAYVGDVDKIPGAFSEIENILMDDLDDMDLSRLPEKDGSFDILNDFGSMLDVDVCVVENTLEAKKRKESLIVEEDMKDDVASEVKEKDVEVEAKNQCKRQKRGIEKGTNELSEFEGRRNFAQKCNNNGELGSSSKTANSINKGDESGSSVKRKSKKAKKETLNNVVSNSTKSKYVEPTFYEKMMKKHQVRNIGKSSTNEVKKGEDKSSKGVQYTREQLLSLQNKKTFISEDILWAMQKVAAELYGETQHSSVVETKVSCSDKSKPSLSKENKAKEMAISDSNNKNQSFSEDNKLANEEKTDSNISKIKKRGSSSEARKEKKRRQRRKKRAEMNKKLGVKRLKLKPIVKNKVVSHCRHYLMGRCNEGDKCKFSHDVIPLTKSKPCCHFARNACMKGDECPFDHQLSKYPCNNFVTTGFCNRGDSCSFSHKAPPPEHVEPESSVSKSDSISLQLNESNSKHKINASTTLASIHASTNTLKGNSVKSTSQPTNAPKGISFLSFEKSSIEDSSKHKGGQLSEPNSTQPNLALESSSNSLLPFDESNSKHKVNATTSLESGYATPNSLKGSLVKSTNQSGNAPKVISFLSFGKSSVEDSSNHKEGELSEKNIIPPNVDVESSSKRTDQGLLSRSINFSQMFKVNQIPSSSGSSHVSSGGKSQVTDSLIGEKGKLNDSNKMKTVQSELPETSTSLGQFSVKDRGERNTSSSALKSLSSTLAFAEKFGSSMKMNSGDSSKVVDKNGVGSDGGSKRNEESNASSILQFLYSGRNKE